MVRLIGFSHLSPLSTRLLLFPYPALPLVSVANARNNSNTKNGFCRLSFSAEATTAEAMKAPVAKKVKHVMEMFGDVRNDDYYWLRDDSRSDPEVLSYLKEENAYTDFVTAGTKTFENELYAELRGRIKEDDISAPTRKGSYYYYERTLEGKEYVQRCRRLIPNGGAPPSVHDVMPMGPGAPEEHVILDENVKAQEHGYYSIGAFEVSPNNKLVAYAEDTKGDEIYTVHVIDAETQTPVGNPLKSVTSYLEWAGDETLVYITMDEILRPDKVWLHKLGSDQSSDHCLYHEKDDMFSLDLQASESKKYLFVGSESKNTRFVFYLDVSKPEDGLMVLTPHVYGIDTSVSHRGNHFFIKKRSDEFFNSELLACPLDNLSATTVLLPHRESVKIQDMQLFSDHLVVYEREDGLPKVTIYSLPPVGEVIESLQGGQAVDFIDPIYSVDTEEAEFSSSVLRFSYSSLKTPHSVYDYDLNTGISVLKKIKAVKEFVNIVLFISTEREDGLPKVTIYSLPPVGEVIESLQGGRAVDFIDPIYSVDTEEAEFSSSVLRFSYSSLKTPHSVYDYDLNTGISVLKKIKAVLGGFDASRYATERQWAIAADGTRVPISIVYRKDLVKLDGSGPLLLHGYGSYEMCIDPSFRATRLSLLDRGFIYAIAHVRGGGEMGRKWYENGKLLKKRNTFTDFIACAEYLIENKYCSKEKLCIEGRSAGGLLIGAVLNMRPDLFKAAVAGVPFVDVVTTMLDPSIPLTTSEWEEWGDPRKEEFYFYMKSYSPVDNIKPQNYPNILVTAGLNDPRVLYSEPAKFVAKLREMKTDDNMLLFKCEFGAGHSSKSGRFEKLQEDAFTYAFVLKALDMVQATSSE